MNIKGRQKIADKCTFIAIKSNKRAVMYLWLKDAKKAAKTNAQAKPLRIAPMSSKRK